MKSVVVHNIYNNGCIKTRPHYLDCFLYLFLFDTHTLLREQRYFLDNINALDDPILETYLTTTIQTTVRGEDTTGKALQVEDKHPTCTPLQFKFNRTIPLQPNYTENTKVQLCLANSLSTCYIQKRSHSQ